MSAERLVIERLGSRGEGVALLHEKRVFIPYALPGEIVTAQVDSDHAQLVDIVEASPQRIAPVCPHFMDCGGCAVQTLRADAYAEWKRSLVQSALSNAGLTCDVAPLVDAHGAGRRRVTFHARFDSGQASVGFMAARSHRIVEIDSCPLLAPELDGALTAARAIAAVLAPRGKPLDIAVTATLGGLDIELRGARPLIDEETSALITAADAHDLARLTNHGRLVALRRAPQINIGEATLTLPAGAFLQATQRGEDEIAARVLKATAKARFVADLFSGVGAFALRLARRAKVKAYDSDGAAIAAMRAAAQAAQGLRTLEGIERDLFTRPLSASELNGFDAIVFDPPRAGAAAQAAEIARSGIPIVVAVSCHAQSFARDAAILLKGGFVIREIAPLDQFRYAAHVEIVAVFEKESRRKSPKRRLLG
ncbi:class I SAM-dependent RNA methyltransferase [Methylocystis sp.]|uniref:class I SAM-dependent RNA methyltransferase n=1 Tax=Methylocystis sp. TaxID=1911079 RepID=UPI003D0B794B